MRLSLGTSIQAGLIVTSLSLATVAVLFGINNLKKTYLADQVRARYEYVSHECSQRSREGYMPDHILLPEKFVGADGVKKGAYALCPLK